MNTNRFLFKVFFAMMVNLFSAQLYAQTKCLLEHCEVVESANGPFNEFCKGKKREGLPFFIIPPDGNTCFCPCPKLKTPNCSDEICFFDSSINSFLMEFCKNPGIGVGPMVVIGHDGEMCTCYCGGQDIDKRKRK